MEARIKRTPEAAQYLGIAASTLDKLRFQGGGPAFVHLTQRAIGYCIEDLDAWIDSLPRETVV